MRSRKRVVVSICVRCVNTSDRVVRRRQDVSSRKMEISVGSVRLSVIPSEVRRMDLRATLGFFTNMRRSALPYFRRRKLRAWRMRRRVAFLSPLKQPCVVGRVVVPMGRGSGRAKTPKVSRFLGGGLRAVRKDSGVAALDHSGREGFSGGGSS